MCGARKMFSGTRGSLYDNQGNLPAQPASMCCFFTRVATPTVYIPCISHSTSHGSKKPFYMIHAAKRHAA